MKPLPALLLLLTITQAVTVCIHDVQRVHPEFNAYVQDNWELSFYANRRTLGLFQKCMRDHGQNIDGATLRMESPS